MENLQIRPLSTELANVAKTELNENPAKIAEDIEYIRNWLQMQPHIVSRTGKKSTSNIDLSQSQTRVFSSIPDDQFLVSFLRGCKYSYEKTKEKLDMYFTVRSAIPEFFYDRDPSYANLQEAISRGYENIMIWGWDFAFLKKFVYFTE